MFNIRQYSKLIKILIITFLIQIVLLGCTAYGTKTLFKTNQREVKISEIGIIVSQPDSVSLMIFPELIEFMENILFNGINWSDNFKVKVISDSLNRISFDPDKNTIRNICMEDTLDGLLISNLKFPYVKHYMYIELFTQNYATIVELKLYDKKGNLILQTSHNTYEGNSYPMLPGPGWTVKDGTYGALDRLIDELGKL